MLTKLIIAALLVLLAAVGIAVTLVAQPYPRRAWSLPSFEPSSKSLGVARVARTPFRESVRASGVLAVCA
jgi:hypothetical protein